MCGLCGTAQGGSSNNNTLSAVATTEVSQVKQENAGQVDTKGQAQTAQGATMEQTADLTGTITAEQKTANGGFHGIEAEGEQATPTAESQQGPNIDQGPLTTDGTDKHGNNMSWLPLLLSLLALALSGYAFFRSYISNDRNKKRGSGKGDNNVSPVIRDALQQNQNIRLSLNSINQRLDELEDRIKSLSTPTPITQPQYQSQYQNNGSSEASPSVIRYAAMVTSDGFPDGDLAGSNSNYTLAILTLTGNTGTFVINDLHSAQSFLISNFAYSVGRICEVKQHNDAATRVETIRPGRISREGNTWRIVSKAEVVLV